MMRFVLSIGLFFLFVCAYAGNPPITDDEIAAISNHYEKKLVPFIQGYRSGSSISSDDIDHLFAQAPKVKRSGQATGHVPYEQEDFGLHFGGQRFHLRSSALYEYS